MVEISKASYLRLQASPKSNKSENATQYVSMDPLTQKESLYNYLNDLREIQGRFQVSVYHSSVLAVGTLKAPRRAVVSKHRLEAGLLVLEKQRPLFLREPQPRVPPEISERPMLVFFACVLLAEVDEADLLSSRRRNV